MSVDGNGKGDVKATREYYVSKAERFGRRYETLEKLDSSSGESDVFIARDNLSGERVLIKFYAFGLFSKEDHTKKIQAIESDHHVRTLSTGRRNGRFYEVLEYIDSGSLKDWMGEEKGCPAPSLRAILKQLAEILAELHGMGLVHGNLNPSNIFVRERHPFSIALGGIGQSSMMRIFPAGNTTRQVDPYASPESLRGMKIPANDWWSLGILLFELRMGKHPFEVSSQQSMEWLMGSGQMDFEESMTDEWQAVVGGLLARKPDCRWEIREVTGWLENEPIAIEGRKPEPAGESEKLREPQSKWDPAFMIDREPVETPIDLWVRSVNHWGEVVKTIEDDSLLSWVLEQVKDDALKSNLEEISADGNLAGSKKLSALLLALAPDLPLQYEGEWVTQVWMQGGIHDAISILESSLPQWQYRLTGEDTLNVIAERRRQLVGEIKPFHDFLGVGSTQTRPPFAIEKTIPDLLPRMTNVTERNILRTDEELRDAYRELTRVELRARHPALADLLKMTDPELGEMIALLSAPSQMLLTPRDYFRQILDDSGLGLDRKITERLLNCGIDEICESAEEYRRTLSKSTVPRLQDILDAEKISLIDAYILLSVPENLFVTDQDLELVELVERRERISRLCKSWDIPCNLGKMELFLRKESEEEVISRALEVRQTFADAQSDFLDALILKPSLNYDEAMIILCAKPGVFRIKFSIHTMNRIPLKIRRFFGFKKI